MTFALLTKKQLTNKIDGIGKRTTTLRQDIHETLCHAAGHAYEHGDVTSFTRLFNATSGMARKDIAAWVAEFGFARLTKDGTYKLNKKTRGEADYASGAACAEYLLAERKWYENEMNAEEIVRALDVAKRMDSLASSIEKADKDDKPITMDVAAMNKASKRLRDIINLVADKRNTANRKTAPLAIAAE